MSIMEFIRLKDFLDEYDIYYESGNYYDDESHIVGHWLMIKEQNFETDDLTDEDRRYNED